MEILTKKARRITWIFNLLPEPWTNRTIDFDAVTTAMQNRIYIGQLRERWEEIKKLVAYAS